MCRYTFGNWNHDGVRKEEEEEEEEEKEKEEEDKGTQEKNEQPQTCLSIRGCLK